jgi:hypothetical protein
MHRSPPLASGSPRLIRDAPATSPRRSGGRRACSGTSGLVVWPRVARCARDYRALGLILRASAPGVPASPRFLPCHPGARLVSGASPRAVRAAVRRHQLASKGFAYLGANGPVVEAVREIGSFIRHVPNTYDGRCAGRISNRHRSRSGNLPLRPIVPTRHEPDELRRLNLELDSAGGTMWPWMVGVLAAIIVAMLVYDYERPILSTASTSPSSNSPTTTGAALATPAKVNPSAATPSAAPVTPAPATQPTPR